MYKMEITKTVKKPKGKGKAKPKVNSADKAKMAKMKMIMEKGMC